MFWNKSPKDNGEALLSHLKEFEKFCLGETHLTPLQFRELNMELSVNAVQKIGKHRYQNAPDGQHLLWTGLDNREYDLGPADSPNVLRDYPGFHKLRSLALGHDLVSENTLIEAPRKGGQVTQVKLKDGTTGIGPNYKMALRNAALKMHLKHQFNQHNKMDVWSRFYGNA